MFAVIYQTYLKPGKEKQFEQAWHAVARYFIENCGALGSCLHKTSDDLWVAYSRWPSKSLRDAAWPGARKANESLPTAVQNHIATIKNCMDEERKIPDIEMEVIDDQLDTEH